MNYGISGATLLDSGKVAPGAILRDRKISVKPHKIHRFVEEALSRKVFRFFIQKISHAVKNVVSRDCIEPLYT
jgi:hypothetical protein